MKEIKLIKKTFWLYPRHDRKLKRIIKRVQIKKTESQVVRELLDKVH